MIPERIKNSISNYNFDVRVYNEVVAHLDLSNGENVQYKHQLVEELQKHEIHLLSTIEGYNTLAKKPIELVTDDTYGTEEVLSCTGFIKKICPVPFKIQTYKLKQE